MPASTLVKMPHCWKSHVTAHFVVCLDSGSDTQHQMEVKSKNKIPVVGLLVQGSPRSIDHVLFYVQNKMPIVVVKGSGGIADVIAYAYEEILERYVK